MPVCYFCPALSSDIQKYVLSFCFNTRVYHNEITKVAEKQFKNSKGTTWESLSMIVLTYKIPHEDMQTVITEHVAQDSSHGKCR